MIARRLFVLVSWMIVACSSGDDAAGDDAGTGGVDAAAMEDSGAVDAGGGSACPEGEQGALRVEIEGLPAGVDAKLELSGPDGSVTLDEATSMDSAASGMYTLSAERVLDDDPIVRGLYDPTVEVMEVCVRADGEATFEVSYALVPTSNKLWVLNDTDDAALLAFASSELGESAAPPDGLPIDVVAGGDVVFDRDGNLWTFGPTTVDPPLVRYAAGEVTDSAGAAPDRMLEVDGVACLPGLRAMAFDAMGNLWLSVCGGKILRLAPSALERGRMQTESVMPDVEISGLADNRDIAFDGEGNLWVADDGMLVRYDADRLDASDSAAPDAAFMLRNAADSQGLGVDYLTFDAEGDLWATDFGGNFVAEYLQVDLMGSDAAPLVANVSLVLAVSALLDRPAFDDAGGLWISYSANKIARIAPADLLVSTDAGDPTAPDVVLDGGDIGNTGNVAFFPAAAGLPLYHAYP